MADKKLIVVVGATGFQGGSVAETFLADPAWNVRTLTRSASGSKAQVLKAKGAEVFEANLNDVQSLEKAFEGAQVVFSVTDFWTLYADQSLQPKSGQAKNELAFELEIQQGKNIFDAAAKVPTLERLIFSSLANTNKLSGGKYTKVFHFDGKAIATEYGEKTYPELWSKTSMVQLGYYLTNLSQHPWLKPKKNPDTGIYEFTTFNPDSPAPMVAAEADTGVFVKALLKSAPGKNLAAFREQMSIVEYAKLWSEVVSVEARAVAGSMDQTPPELKQELEETFAWAKEFGFYGEKVDKSVVTPQDLDPTLTLGTVEDWIKAQNWSDVTGA